MASRMVIVGALVVDGSTQMTIQSADSGWYTTLCFTGITDEICPAGHDTYEASGSFFECWNGTLSVQTDGSALKLSQWAQHSMVGTDKVFYASDPVSGVEGGGAAFGVLADFWTEWYALKRICRPVSAWYTNVTNGRCPVAWSLRRRSDCPAKCIVPAKAPYQNLCVVNLTEQACYEDRRCIPEESMFTPNVDVEGAGFMKWKDKCIAARQRDLTLEECEESDPSQQWIFAEAPSSVAV